MKTYVMSAADPRSDPIGTEASHWLLRLQEDAGDHRNTFLAWITQSPRHLTAFLETFETHRLLGGMDPGRTLDVEAMLKDLDADVITLRRNVAGDLAKPKRHLGKVAASIAAVGLLALAAWYSPQLFGTRAYATAVGEQRTFKLADGSVIHLNTDSRIEVRFSGTERLVRLEQGEALFLVERDSTRPFTVSTEDARIRVLGTQFNVRRRSGLTDVAVIEGAVQVAALEPSGSSQSAATVPLRTGEKARVRSHQIIRKPVDNVEGVLAWRARRLSFTEATLGEVAAEFNRYNERKIEVEGRMASSKRMTGIFDADRPAALILYAMKEDSLVVEPRGDAWVIKDR